MRATLSTDPEWLVAAPVRRVIPSCLLRTSLTVIPDDPFLRPVLERFRGRRDLATRVVNAFVAQTPLDLQLLSDALLAQNAQEVARVAHRVKGAAANIGMSTMQTHAAAAERFARQGDLAEAEPSLRSLCRAWREFYSAWLASQQLSHDLHSESKTTVSAESCSCLRFCTDTTGTTDLA